MPANIRLNPGSVLPRDMDQRQWDSHNAQSRADYIKHGQTDYDTGTGYFLGDHNGIAKFSIGNSSGNKLTWDGTTLAISGNIDLSNTVQTFVPNWLWFSSPPNDAISYLDLGRIVFMWSAAGSEGTSNDQFMQWDAGSIPAAIRPSSGQRVIACQVVDGVTSDVWDGAIQILADGSATFTLAEAGGAHGSSQQANTFTTAAFSQKGLPAGWLISYPK